MPLIQINVVQTAVDLTGMTELPIEDGTVPLSDNDPGLNLRASQSGHPHC